MPSKTPSRIIGAIMLVFAIGFFIFAVTHPTGSFPWSNGVTHSIYFVYILVMVIFFAAPFRKKG